MSEHQNSPNVSVQTSTGVADASPVNEGAPVGFFAVGIVINLVLVAAYIAWAWRRWKRPDSSKPSR